MVDTTTLNEQARAPLDGTESIRLATSGANWKAQINQPNAGGVSWPFGTVSGGTTASSTLVLESTSGAGTSDFIFFKTGSQVEQLRISTGQVTVGSNGSYLGDHFEVHGTGGTPASCTQGIFGWGANFGSGTPVLNGLASRGTTFGTQTAVATNDTMFQVGSQGSDGTNFVAGASIGFLVDGTVASNSVPTRMVFATGTTGGGTERSRIDSVGNTNIGMGGASINNGAYSVTPLLELGEISVKGVQIRHYSADASGTVIGMLKSRGASIGTNTALQSGDTVGVLSWTGYDATGTPVERELASITGVVDAAPTAGTVPGRLVFNTAIGGSTTERMRIDRNGNVTVNTAAISTSATDGFLYLETCAGAPTGTPTSYTGRSPVIIDTTNNYLWFYNGAWKNVGISPAPHCGRLVVNSSTQIAFQAYNGDTVRINAIDYHIAASSITSANTSVFLNGTSGQNLAASTLYYVYLFNNSGTLTFDFSTTGHATDTGTGNVGVEIKSGNSSRTLIGMIRTNASSQFQDDGDGGNNIFVASWFNRRLRTAETNNASNVAAGANNTFFSVNATQASLLVWGDMNGTINTAACTYFNSAGAAFFQIGIWTSGSNHGPINPGANTTAANLNQAATGFSIIAASEGLYQAGLSGSTGSATGSAFSGGSIVTVMA